MPWFYPYNVHHATESHPVTCSPLLTPFSENKFQVRVGEALIFLENYLCVTRIQNSRKLRYIVIHKIIKINNCVPYSPEHTVFVSFSGYGETEVRSRGRSKSLFLLQSTCSDSSTGRAGSQPWAWILTQPHTSCVNFDKLLSASGLQFSLLWKGKRKLP